MKFENRLSTFLLLAFTLFAGLNATAQITDSINIDHGFLYYHEYGSPDFPPVIILTGGPGNSYIQLKGLAETISQKFRGILLEQRGTGNSIPTPFDSTTINLQAVTMDITTLMDRLKLEKATIVGHSWGGMLAMNFAAKFPERVKHLILIGPGPHKDAKNGFDVLFTNRTHTRSFDEEQRLKQLNQLIANSEADSLEIIESRKLARRAYIFANPLPDSIFLKINVENNSKTAALLMNDIFQNFDVSESLKNYQGQVDIITGRQDVVGFFSYELKQDRPSASLHWINECGHFPMYEQPAEFYKILYQILEE